jgi:Stigma-specific protein, Stig1
LDGQRFDNLVRLLAARSPRRTVLRALAAGALGGQLRPGAGAAKPEDDDDACLDEGGTCAHTGQCCVGLHCCKHKCKELFADRKNCGACGHACYAGRECCHGKCRDVRVDEHNCGKCGHACGEGQVCCKGRCIDVLADARNCGACGKACPDQWACCDGRCIDVRADPDSCGWCGNTCPDGYRICCPEPPGWCTDLTFDDYNCGACGLRCYDDESNYTGPCTNGTCGCAETGEGCQKDLHCCQGRCVDGTCHPCSLPGSTCRDDFDCCGGHGSGRCIDGKCRCCQYGQDESFFCNGAISSAEVPCCGYPQSAVECVNPATGDCAVVCGIGPDGDCPPRYEETGKWADANPKHCTTGQ